MESVLKYSRPARFFEEALPLGNGQLGAMVYGGVERERISLNHDTLWSGKPGDEYVNGAYDAYKKAKALIKEGKNFEAQAEIDRNFTGKWLCSYMLLGNLYMETLGASGEAADYLRTLDMASSTVKISYTQGGIDFTREYFVSFPHNCMMIRFKSSKPVTYSFNADCVGKSAVTRWGNTLCLSGECPTSIAPNYDKGSMPVLYDGDGVKVSALARVISDGRLREGHDVSLVTEDATDVTLYFCAETSFVSFDKLPNKPTFYPCLERLDRLCELSYESIRESHVNDVSALFNRVYTDFGGDVSERMTNERLMDDNKDIGLCELLYNFGRYLIIASSREGSRATNLQGIWNEQFYAPWSSNYTVNINTQMNYWPVLMNNLVSCNLPLVEHTVNMSVNGRETAKRFYNADGFVSHHNTDLWAHTTPVGNGGGSSSGFAYWNMSGAWFCRHLFEHYEYTLDEGFLRETAYPVMKSSAEFFLSVMEYDESIGKWIISPATSPENSYIDDEGRHICVAKYTTMSQSIVEDLFKCISRGAEILGIDDDFTRLINERKDDIGIYKCGSEGQLLEYDGDYTESDINHRHVSHLYGFYPGGVITAQKNPEVAQMVRRSLERRGDDGTGWSMGWKVCLWARLKDGDRALKLVKNQLRYISADMSEWPDGFYGGGTYPNMFDAHPPFQIDGNFGVCAGITQMLLQCEDDKIIILPALPNEMKKGCIRGLLAKGNITVDIEWENNKAKKIRLITPVSQGAVISVNGEDMEISLKENEEYIISVN